MNFVLKSKTKLNFSLFKISYFLSWEFLHVLKGLRSLFLEEGGVYYTPTLSNQLHRERGGVEGKDPRREDLGHVKCNFYVFLQNHFPTLSCIWIRVTAIERYQKKCWWRVEEWEREDVNFTNILWTPFLYESCAPSLFVLTF